MDWGFKWITGIDSFWFWMILFFIIIFCIWVFYGGEHHEFVGLRPLLHHLEPISPYISNSSIVDEVRSEKKKKSFGRNSDDRNRSRGEEMCCSLMEELTGREFRKVRPAFLRNPMSGCNLELDGYNDELKIGVEYNGLQHYLWPNSFHKTEQEFHDLVWRDKFKREQCDRHGVYLITVPYHVPFSKIKQFLINALPSTLFLEEEEVEEEEYYRN